jgi:hypothetical protein
VWADTWVALPPDRTARHYHNLFTGTPIAVSRQEGQDRIALDQVFAAFLGSTPREDINQALGVGQSDHRYANVEVKYKGPDGVTVDVSETGWVGTSGLE